MKRLLWLPLFFLLTQLCAQDLVLSAKKDWAYYVEILELTLQLPGEEKSRISGIELEVEGDLHLFDQKRESSYSFNVSDNEGVDTSKEIFLVIPLSEAPLQVKARVDLKDGVSLYSNTLDLSVLPHPIKEKDLFVYVHNMTEDWIPGQAGNVLVEVFSIDRFKGESLPFELSGKSRVRALEGLDEETVYLNQLYHRMASFPYRLIFDEPGEYTLLPDELELPFLSSEGNQPYTALVPVIQDPLTVSVSPVGESPLLSWEVEAEPEIWNKGEEVKLTIELTSDGDLSSLSSLLPYGDWPAFLEESENLTVYTWEQNRVWEKRSFVYRGTVPGSMGVNLKSITLPPEAGGVPLTIELGRMKGNFHPAAVGTFFGVMLLTAIGLVLFILLTIRKSRKNYPEGPEKANLQDIYLFSDEFKLTNRERDVLKILVNGKSTKEIADELFISPDTAKKHINNIMSKTETHSRLEIYVLMDKYVKKSETGENL
ncbi:MAG: helix-turn-helix transcriptional regulator [Spirochaetales bacterium]|nr:helix-turn-helix transcriptional regulator [Spirochaetales bacterium]